jgi:PAS domain S-box-containing protein
MPRSARSFLTRDHPATFRLAAIVESSDDAIISQALDGTIESWNRGAERIFGYTPNQAIGRRIDIIVPADRRADEERLNEVLRSGEAVRHFETVGLSKAGVRIPISVALSPMTTPDGELVGISRIARDISGQKVLEREAFRLAAIVDSAEDAIVSKNLEGIVQTWNKGAERMFGYTVDEMIGRSIMTIIPSDRLGEEDDILGRIRSGQRIEHFETVRRRRDGTLVDVSLSVSPITTSAGVIIGASKIARDITPLRQLVRAAEEANRIKDEFLAMVSHELRTPLNAVMGYSRMLRSGHVSEERQERAIDIIERNAALLSQIVSDLLDVSTIVTGKIRLNPTPCDLVALVTTAADSIRPSAEAKGLALRVHTPPEPIPTRCDTNRMQQVLWNLLNNAVKFTPRGGAIEFSLTASDTVAEISIKDTGVGIRRDLFPYLFQRFWQAESTATRHAGGLGLGLALARHFVELHGGSIRASSEGEGKGATFVVSLPVNP